ncbi:MAG TPA: TerB family tellurite resistance protein [Bacteroidales bacterium]|nr:TerB family tellurite resistance protein [Bacteroidales bacterium]
MAKFGKWIAGGLGWAFMGPVGGIIGFIVGSVIDEIPGNSLQQTGQTTSGDFAVSLLVLVAALMKADGRVMRSELNWVKNYLEQTFGRASAAEAIQLLQKLLKQEIPVDDVALQMRQRMDYASRLQLLHFLYGIANADKELHPDEIRLINHIADMLGISADDKQSVNAMFYDDVEAAYKVLNISPSATDDEVKKAYRKMAVKNHPDKVGYLGDDIKKAAENKFQQLNAAYEKIKKKRGIK